MENVHGLHRLESSVPQGRLHTPKHQPHDRWGSQTQDVEFSGCLFRLQSDKDGSQGQGENDIHHQIRKLLLQSHVFRTKKCQSHVPTLDGQSFPKLAWMKPGSLCG